MKFLVFLALFAVAFAEEDLFHETLPTDVVSSNLDDDLYDVAEDSLEDDGTWIYENVYVNMGYGVDSTIDMYAGPCSSNAHHEQVKLTGSTTNRAMSMFVTFYPDDETKREDFEFGLFGEDVDRISQVSNIPNHVLEVESNPIIYVQTEGGHEKRMGDCNQLTEPVTYNAIHLREVEPQTHVNFFSDLQVAIEIQQDGSLSVRGASKHHGKKARIHFKGCQRNGAPTSCHGPARGGIEEVPLGDSINYIVSDKLAEFNATIRSAHSDNPPFEVFFGAYEFDSEYDESLDRPVVSARGLPNCAPNCARHGKPNKHCQGKPQCKRNGKGYRGRVGRRNRHCKPNCPGSIANPPNSIKG